MSALTLDREMLEFAIAGGSFYGGGGGGAPALGHEVGETALSLGVPYLVDIDEIPPHATLLTVSAVGSPAAGGRHAGARHYLKAVEIFMEVSGLKIDGFITNECGGLATVNGWVQSAGFGLPVVDCPCNGRAHPTGAMGSMGLHRDSAYVSVQAAVGGSCEDGTWVEVYVKGTLEKASNMIRQAAVQANGLVAVARNPVSAGYARNHGAPGAVNQCIKVGRAIVEARTRSPFAAIEAAAEASEGTVVCTGQVLNKEIETEGGFDLGKVLLGGGFELAFWNEYMIFERRGKGDSGARLATFPDLITTFDMSTGLPLSSAEVASGHQVAVVVVPRDSLILGQGVKDKSLYNVVEKVIKSEF